MQQHSVGKCLAPNEQCSTYKHYYLTTLNLAQNYIQPIHEITMETAAGLQSHYIIISLGCTLSSHSTQY